MFVDETRNFRRHFFIHGRVTTTHVSHRVYQVGVCQTMGPMATAAAILTRMSVTLATARWRSCLATARWSYLATAAVVMTAWICMATRCVVIATVFFITTRFFLVVVTATAFVVTTTITLTTVVMEIVVMVLTAQPLVVDGCSSRSLWARCMRE